MTIDELQATDEGNTVVNPFYISLSDLMVLLCVFFIMLVAVSNIDVGSFEKVRTGFSGNTENTLIELAENLQAIIEGEPGVPGVKARLAEDGVRLDLDTAALFSPGRAALRPGSLEPLQPLLLEVLSTDYDIDIEGHTDDTPLYRAKDGELETNWSLSGKRAGSVVQHLSEMGFVAERMRIVGYANTKPKTPIGGLSGDGLEIARRDNRRVTILIR